MKGSKRGKLIDLRMYKGLRESVTFGDPITGWRAKQLQQMKAGLRKCRVFRGVR